MSVMFLLKKVFVVSLLIILALIFLFYVGMYLLALDPKDRCLDQGGRYNEIQSICEKE